MADTLQNIPLPASTWVNLYLSAPVAGAGIVVGDRLSLQNIGESVIRVNSGATQPTSSSGFREISPGEIWSNEAGDSGAWAFSPVIGGLVNIRGL